MRFDRLNVLFENEDTICRNVFRFLPNTHEILSFVVRDHECMIKLDVSNKFLIYSRNEQLLYQTITSCWSPVDHKETD